MTEEQLENFEEAALMGGDTCHFCQAEEYGVDANGKRLSRGDEDEAIKITEFHIDHAQDCPVTLVKNLRAKASLWPSGMTEIWELAWDWQGEWASKDVDVVPGWAKGYKRILAVIEDVKSRR